MKGGGSMNTKKTLMSFEKDVYQFLINEHKSVVVDNCKKIADYGIAHTVAMLDSKADIYNNCYDVTAVYDGVEIAIRIYEW